MIGDIARKSGTSEVQYPRDVHLRDCCANESPSRRLSSEAKTAPPLPVSRPRIPYGIQTVGHSTLYPSKPRRYRTTVCLSAPGTEGSGTGPSPSPCLLRAFWHH